MIFKKDKKKLDALKKETDEAEVKVRKEREESQWEEKIFITEKDCVEK